MFEQTFWIAERSLHVRTDLGPALDYWNAACRRLVRSEIVEVPRDRAAIAWDGTRASVIYEGRRLGVNHAPGDATDAAVRATAVVFAECFRRLSCHRALYAAGVARKGSALALVGPSGIGKTTLTVELLQRGWQTFGDEFVLLERGTFAMQPFPLAFMLREPALRLRAGLFASRQEHLATSVGGSEAWHGFDAGDLFGAQALAAPQPLTHVVFLERGSAIRQGLQTLRPATAAFELLPHLFIDRPQLDEIWEVLDRLTAVRCYRLAFQNFGDAAGALLQLSEESACTSTPAI